MHRTLFACVTLVMVAACAGSEPTADAEIAAADTTDASTTADTAERTTVSQTAATPTTTSTLPTTTTSTSTTSTTTSTSTTSTTTTPPPDGASFDLSPPSVTLGSSVEGRPIVAERFGTPGGRPVLVIGVIHGNEDAGVAIVDQLRERPVPDGVELWLVESMNPDGQAIGDRHNANHVDLNRNFPHNWGPIGVPGDGQYAGPSPASEPETQVMVSFISQLRPDIVVWYHQDLYVINPSNGRDGRIRARYAELTGLPMGEITGGTYTGIAATWANRELEADDSVAFIVELGPTLSAAEASTHADAVLTVAAEG